jgi:outer membrane protein
MRLTLALLVALPAWAQDSLALQDAVRAALRGSPALAGAAAGARATGTRVVMARSGLLPKVNYAENFARSNNPVFVFSSLLTQHQFGAGNFAIGPLNQPDFLNNFQSQVTVDQPIYDAGLTRNAVKSAELAVKMSAEEQRRVEMGVIAQTAATYYGVILAAESLKAAGQAVRSAEADLARADAVRTAGMATDADVLSIRVHLAAVKEQRINRSAGLDVARATLNDALGIPLDTAHQLTTPLAPLTVAVAPLDSLEGSAASARPEARETHLAASLAENQVDAARRALRPQIGFRGAFEADRQRFIDRGGANWLASVGVKWNLFNGNADKARIAEATQLAHRAEADRNRTESGLRLEVRRAYAALQAAQERIQVAGASVTQAEESLRITQNRYEAGMNNVTDLLRTETAVLESRTRYLAAIHDQRVAAIMLELAAGRLTADSEVLR